MRRHGRRVHFFGLVLLLAILCQPGAGQLGPAPQHIYPVFNSPGVGIDPGRYLAFPFEVRVYRPRTHLAGRLQARGGVGNDLRVLVYKDQQVIYDSGPRRFVVLSLPLPGPGSYALVLSNILTTPSPKVVWGYINLVSDGAEAEPAAGERKLEAERKRDAERRQAGQEVLMRLHQSLRTLEQQMGTERIPEPPRLGLSPEGETQAEAAPDRPTIWINRESFEIAEASGGQKEDVLAGVLGHELAHAYYRYRTGGRNSSLWDELRGELTLERAQEQEADRLGVRLACLAGFNPEGVILWLRSVMERHGDAGGFRSARSQAEDRIASLEQEARACLSPVSQVGPGPGAVSGLPRKSIEDIFKSETDPEAEERPKLQRRGETAPQAGEKTEPEERPKLRRRNQETATESSASAEPEGRPILRRKSQEVTTESTTSAEAAGERAQAPAPGKPQGGDSPLRIISKEQPEYTEEARRRGVKGTVVLSAVFTLDGRVTDIRVVKGLPYGLTEKAIEAAKRTQFEPATRDGVRLSIRTKIEFDFTP